MYSISPEASTVKEVVDALKKVEESQINTRAIEKAMAQRGNNRSTSRAVNPAPRETSYAPRARNSDPRNRPNREVARRDVQITRERVETGKDQDKVATTATKRVVQETTAGLPRATNFDRNKRPYVRVAAVSREELSDAEPLNVASAGIEDAESIIEDYYEPMEEGYLEDFNEASGEDIFNGAIHMSHNDSESDIEIGVGSIRFIDDDESMILNAKMALGAKDSMADEILAQPPAEDTSAGKLFKAANIAAHKKGTVVNTVPIRYDGKVLISSRAGNQPVRSKSERLCMVIEMELYGVKALTLIDSGSETNTLSLDFARACNIPCMKLERPVTVQLGTKGSRSIIHYGTNVDIEINGAKLVENYFDILNVERYDAILGTPFLNKMEAKLDFSKNNREIAFKGIKIVGLSMNKIYERVSYGKASKEALRAKGKGKKEEIPIEPTLVAQVNAIQATN